MIVAFIGSRGGAGATTLATNVAVALAQRAGSRTALIDLDVGGTIVEGLLALPESGGTVVELAPALAEVASDDVGEAIVAEAYLPHASGLRVIVASREIVAARIDGDAVRTLLRAVARANDEVIIDLPSRLDDATEAALGAADTVVLVTTPEVPSLRRAKGMLRRIREGTGPGAEVRVALAQADRSGGVPLWEIETFLGEKVWAALPFVPDEAAAFHDRRVVPVLAAPAPFGDALRSIAERLAPAPAAPVATAATEPASERPLRARITVTKGGGGRHELEPRVYVIGRSNASDITVADPSVSGRHAQISPRGVAFVIADLGSTNGTTIDDQRLDGERELRGGETIGVGDARLRYEVIA